jgi:cardiolipin synthase
MHEMRRLLEIFHQINATGLSVVHVLLAIFVTVHVLFHERDVGASTGWIGLAWLSPILGSILYAIFGINRVKRRANQLREKLADRYAAEPRLPPAGRDDHLAALERAGDQITRHRAERGTAVTVLQNGDEAYPKMIAAIDAGEASVALSSYIFRADDAGSGFINALIRARQRGVKVRVLIDGIGGGYFLPTNGYDDTASRSFVSRTHRYRGVCLSSTSAPIGRFSLWMAAPHSRVG